MISQEMHIGLCHQTTHRITSEMIERFAEATGDFNPLHLDEEFARGTLFGRRVAHGMLLAGILSGVLGTQFPGVGTIYVSQTLRFRRPVFIGDELTLTLRVVERMEGRKRLRLETIFVNQDGETVLTGEAVVIPPSAP
jgi:acyl dehydratase